MDDKHSTPFVERAGNNFLVAIVFTVILKSAIDWIYGLVGLIIFAMVIMMAVKIYKKYREE